MGGPVWVCFSRGRGLFFTSQKQLQSNEKQTTTTTAKDIFFIVSFAYCDMKNKRQKQDHRTQQKQIIFCLYYKVSKFFAKNIKKNLQSCFFCCTFVPAKQKTQYHVNRQSNNLRTIHHGRKQACKETTKESI